MDLATKKRLRLLDWSTALGAPLCVAFGVGASRAINVFFDGANATWDGCLAPAIALLVIMLLGYRASRRALLAVGVADRARLQQRGRLEMKLELYGACRWFVPLFALLNALVFVALAGRRGFTLGWPLAAITIVTGVLGAWRLGWVARARLVRARSEFGG